MYVMLFFLNSGMYLREVNNALPVQNSIILVFLLDIFQTLRICNLCYT